MSLFAPYSVNFDVQPKNDSAVTSPMSAGSNGSGNMLSDRLMGRSGSTGRNSIWKGRRSSVHRIPTTPLGSSGEPHSRRRSTFSVNAMRMAPVSRNDNNTDFVDKTATSPTANGNSAYLVSTYDNGQEKDMSPPSGKSRHLGKPGPSQFAYSLDEAAGAHTPPITTLDFTRKQNIDKMREKRERKEGAGKHGRFLQEKYRVKPNMATADVAITQDVTALPTNVTAVDSVKDLITYSPDQQQQKQQQQPNSPNTAVVDVMGAMQLDTHGSECSAGAINIVPGTDDEFVIEHLNVGNIGLVNAVNASLDMFAERVWIGELGISTDDWSEERKQAVSNKLLDEVETYPVFVSDKEFDGHYNRFSKQLIWPAFHYIMPEMPRWHGWEKSAFEAAKSTCEKFAERVAEIYREGDIIWINDYHLMLLPEMLRQRLPGAKIGFFLHIPFPSSEIFRCLHVRKELLCGMLGADVVGLQTFSYKRHFIHTAKRVLGVEGSPSGLTLDRRGHVVVGQYAMGLDSAGVEDKWSNASVGELIEFLNDKYSGKHLLIGRDKLDHVKGVRQKMLGYEAFLNDNPEFRSNTVLLQIALTTAEHNELQVQVMDVVNRINSRYGTIEHQPVTFFHKDIPYNHYLALLSTADAMLITSLRDGMNLTSHEYVLCQREKKSPLVLSEFVGTYGAFSGGALGVNPMDTRAMSQAIKDALTMNSEEKTVRWELLRAQVQTNSANSFVSSFVEDIEKAHVNNNDNISGHIK